MSLFSSKYNNPSQRKQRISQLSGGSVSDISQEVFLTKVKDERPICQNMTTPQNIVTMLSRTLLESRIRSNAAVENQFWWNIVLV